MIRNSVQYERDTTNVTQVPQLVQVYPAYVLRHKELLTRQNVCLYWTCRIVCLKKDIKNKSWTKSISVPNFKVHLGNITILNVCSKLFQEMFEFLVKRIQNSKKHCVEKVGHLKAKVQWWAANNNRITQPLVTRQSINKTIRAFQLNCFYKLFGTQKFSLLLK